LTAEPLPRVERLRRRRDEPRDSSAASPTSSPCAIVARQGVGPQEVPRRAPSPLDLVASSLRRRAPSTFDSELKKHLRRAPPLLDIVASPTSSAASSTFAYSLFSKPVKRLHQASRSSTRSRPSAASPSAKQGSQSSDFFACSLAHSLAYSLARSLACLLARLFACSLAPLLACLPSLLARLLACSLACLPACLLLP